ncbi:DUF924 family protein [Roseateles sp.]|uniref:DUF924 family protein n=1 Tax=Roseateles sp. TaxID=1971397 RepID=UPI0039394127
MVAAVADCAPQVVLNFWFQETKPAQWWSAEPAFDTLIRSRFGALHARAAAGELWAWRGQGAHGRLAEILVLDQFSRNLGRGTPLAFAQDGMALVLAQEAVAAGAQAELADAERPFLLMPYMHSESRAVHEVAVALFSAHAPGNLDFELRHKAIVDRFGRYPHRNAVLGRVSSEEELEFLKQPGSSF